MKKRDIIIVISSIATALICIVLTFWGNYKNKGVLSPDAFYSILATFIGICATIIVGFQIASFIKIHETERQIKEVQKERDEMLKEKEELYKNIKSIRTLLANALVGLFHNSNNNFEKIITMMMSICCDKEMDSTDVVLRRYQSLDSYVKKANSNELLRAKEYMHNLKRIDIPKEIEHYTEIMKLHLEIIEIFDNVAKEEDNEITKQ